MHLAIHNILKPYITQKDYIFSNEDANDKTGYNLYLIDTIQHQNLTFLQLIKVRFDFKPAVPAATNLIGYAHLLTNRKKTISSDGQRHFDLI